MGFVQKRTCQEIFKRMELFLIVIWEIFNYTYFNWLYNGKSLIQNEM